MIPVTPGRLPEPVDLSESGEAFQMNMVYAFGFDCTDVFDLTKAEIAGRQQALWAIDALRHYVPGFENVRLRNFGATLGTRESRLIEGKYVLLMITSLIRGVVRTV